MRCILVRDPRFRAGGFETWVETLIRGLPGRGIAVTLLVPGGGLKQFGDADVRAIPASEDPGEQAAHVVEAVASIGDC
ncbi:MAG TPA: hypothetical protein VN605_07755, partial [Thermoanaerobaculia bacterium]|nr:hypothetical protein [Thermoanaerobaculia bacterium]